MATPPAVVVGSREIEGGGWEIDVSIGDAIVTMEYRDGALGAVPGPFWLEPGTVVTEVSRMSQSGAVVLYPVDPPFRVDAMGYYRPRFETDGTATLVPVAGS